MDAPRSPHANRQLPSVKAEPQEITSLADLARRFGMDTQTRSSNLLTIKQEHSEATNVPSSVGALGSPAQTRGNSLNVTTQAKMEDPFHSTLVPTQAPPVALMRFQQFNSPQEIDYSHEKALSAGAEMVKAINEGLSHIELGKLRQNVWMREVESLLKQGTPTTLIAVCGATGAGKSSVLNAILDDNIVPTSGMRACTAVVTEVAYHNKQTIDADISFLTLEEWKQELAVLLHDLVDEEGRTKRTSDLKSDAGVAWQKVHAVYPSIVQDQLATMTVEQIITRDPKIAVMLGTIKHITARDSKTFSHEVTKYIDSKDSKRDKKSKEKKKDKAKTQSEHNEPAYWPLIRQVNVRCAAKALSTGAVLVDLPGVADANAARNSIAKDYMKKCNCIWILAPITRAVDDKTARDLLGDAFKLQLKNGNYDGDAITFVATKCDDVSCSEVIGALNLEDEPKLEAIEERLADFDQRMLEQKSKKSDAVKTIAGVKDELSNERQRLRDYEEQLDALQRGEVLQQPTTSHAGKKRKGQKDKDRRKAKRKRTSDNEDDSDSYSTDDSSVSSASESVSDRDSDSGSSDSEADEMEVEDGLEDVTEESLKDRIDKTCDAIKQIRKKLKAAKEEKQSATDALATLKKDATKAQKEKNAFCSLRRSKFSRDVLKEDFRTGLKELDDSTAEQRDPQNFDPNVQLRDYDTIDLPVFTVSSRDYVRLKRQVKGDGEPNCFSNVNDTGIPDLQNWCQSLTSSSRERSTRNFLTQLKTFAATIKSYFESSSQVTACDRDSLRQIWESKSMLYPIETRSYHFLLGSLIYPPDGRLRACPWDVEAPENTQPTGIMYRLNTEFENLVCGNVESLKNHFKEGLEEKCKAGVIQAAKEAVNISDNFAASMHWATYRATLRRHGAFRRDLNVELVNPFTRAIANSWSKVFETDIFSGFEAHILGAISALVSEIENSAAASLKERAKAQGGVCSEEAVAGLKKALHLAQETLTAQQKEASRSMAPHVQTQLADGYNKAMEEHGTGSVARQKTVFRNYISDCKDEMFDDGADVLMSRLDEAAEAIGSALKDSLTEVAQKVEVSMSVLWEDARESPTQAIARHSLLALINAISTQVDMWILVQEVKRTQNT